MTQDMDISHPPPLHSFSISIKTITGAIGWENQYRWKEEGSSLKIIFSEISTIAEEEEY
jgi:hypothetical protein